MMQEKQIQSRRISFRINRFKRYLPIYIGLAPFFILYIFFVLIPMVQGVAMSFTDWSTRTTRTGISFVGLENFRYLLFSNGISSRRFIKSMQNLLVYTPITCALGVSLSLIVALMVNQFKKKTYSFFQGAFFVPRVLPLFLVSGIWMWFMSSETGLVASNLAKIGIGRNITWVYTQGYAIAICIIIAIWHSVGFNFILLCAGMKNIPTEYYEAAEIDGASTFQKMRYITLPLLEPVLFFVITYALINSVQLYDTPAILTRDPSLIAIGGPAQVMLFPVMEMVRNVYSGDASGYARAAAEGVMLMMIIIIITVIQFRFRKKRT